VLTTVREELLQRPDLIDRTLHLHLPPLDPNNRKTEAELGQAWDADRPHLLADLLDLVAGGMARLDHIKHAVASGLLPPPPRLVDAALLAEAVAQATGWKPGLCLSALNAMRAGDATRQLEEHPCAARIRDLLSTKGGRWVGTMRELMNHLRMMDGPDWGRSIGSIQAFTIAIDRIAGPLREVWRIGIERSRTQGARTVTLSYIHDKPQPRHPARSTAPHNPLQHHRK
jgi:hypothetical protein